MNEHDRIPEALSHVPADDRETWVRMGMAVKAALGESGFTIWNAWSQSGEGYKANDARAVWRSIKSSGGIGPGSLYAEARSHGWDGQAPTVDPAVEARRRARRAAEERAEAERVKAEQARAAALAQRLVAKARIGMHAYLGLKGFPQAQGLTIDLTTKAWKYLRLGGEPRHPNVLLLPMRNVEGNRLLSVQLIQVDGTKKFLTGGRARGTCFRLGRGSETYLCEGYATALSVRAALEILYRRASVVVCFSAANLATVAASLTGPRYVVADNDSSGTGQSYALKTQLPWWMPPALDTDANDFHRAHGLRALADQLNELRRQ